MFSKQEVAVSGVLDPLLLLFPFYLFKSIHIVSMDVSALFIGKYNQWEVWSIKVNITGVLIVLKPWVLKSILGGKSFARVETDKLFK